MPTYYLIQWSHNGIEISEGKFPAEIDTTPCPVLRRTTTTTTNNNNNTSSRFSHNFHFCSIPTQYQPTTARNTQHPTVVGGHCPHLPSWWRQDLRKELHLPLWSQRDPRRELLPLFNHYLRRLLLLQQQRPTRRGRGTDRVTRRGRRRRRRNPRRRSHVPKENRSTLNRSPRKG